MPVMDNIQNDNITFVQSLGMSGTRQSVVYLLYANNGQKNNVHMKWDSLIS